MKPHTPFILLPVWAACLLNPAMASDPDAAGAADASVMRWTGKPITGPDAPRAPVGPQQPAEPAAHLPTPRAATDPAAATGGYAIDTRSREGVRLLYKTIFTSSNGVNSDWVGNVAACDAGATSTAYQAATLRRINWFRAMAGVPASITFDATYNQKAQQAALIMSANQQLSHTPPTHWRCHSAAGAEAAGKSNIGIGSAGPEAIAEGYLRDPGSNNAAVGHRRWMLYPQTQVMGIGNVAPAAGTDPSTSAVWVQDGRFGSPRPPVRDDFVAWPPQGFVPYDTVYPRWSFSYPNADFSGSTVSMTANGVAMATRREPVANGYGENTLVWLPGNAVDDMPWARPEADTVYAVTVNNVKLNGQPRSFSYTVTVMDPEVAGLDTPNLSPQGSTSLGAGQTGTYTFATEPGNATYQWRALTVASYPLADGAEAGSANFTAGTGTGNGYALVTADAAATGRQSFHLAHPQGTDQTLLLNAVLVPSATASLGFASRLGLSSPEQTALVEASSDEGQTWTVLFRQAGAQGGTTSSFGEPGFSRKTVSLAAYANKTLRLRFRYAFQSGSFYPQSTAGIGWYIDDIGLTGVDAVVASNAPTALAGPPFSYTAAQSGSALLQVRAGLYGHHAEWGAALRVNTVAGQVISRTDCLFNWAEQAVHWLLYPPATTQTAAPYTFRYYSGSNAYLGVSSVDDHVLYVVANTTPITQNDLGAQSDWLAQAGCR